MIKPLTLASMLSCIYVHTPISLLSQLLAICRKHILTAPNSWYSQALHILNHPETSVRMLGKVVLVLFLIITSAAAKGGGHGGGGHGGGGHGGGHGGGGHEDGGHGGGGERGGGHGGGGKSSSSSIMMSTSSTMLGYMTLHYLLIKVP